MKKNFKYALMSAIALTGAVSFSACSSSDEVIDNPDYNPETNSVKATITLSVNPVNAYTSDGASTRQQNDVVQASGNFRGIQNIILVPSSTGEITTSTSTESKLTLENFAVADYNKETKNYKLYADKDVLVGVNRFLFLGKAIPGSTNSISGKLANGYTENTFSSATAVGGIAVTPQTITTASGSYTTQSANLAAYLDDIASAGGWAGNSNTSLNDMYSKFTRTTNSAGSASAVLLTLQDLYRKIEAVNSIDATTVSNIRTKISNQVVVSGSGETANLAWKDACTFKDFPTALGLPEGAVQYKYNTSTNKFEYSTGSNNATATPVDQFIYPNELYYLTNSPIRVSSSKTVLWPTTASNWQSESWTSWGNAVDGSTKNIALKYNIQYGSALLATQVKCEATTLYDNAKNLAPGIYAENQAIDISTNKFKLTGVIIGGQPSSVEWNFLPPSDATYTKAVYDRLTTGVDVGTDYTSENTTLVFDDNKATPTDVNVCLEFQNTSGKDFYGKDGIILQGQKFYLIGKLEVTKEGLTNPVGDVVDETAASYFPSKVIRAFIQDFKTLAQFQIKAGSADGTTAGSLQNALSTIPDLRATSQSIGLSVDLTWRTGLAFEVPL